VNMVASFAVPNIVQITWVDDTTDYMIGQITAVDPVGLTITVDVTSVTGATGIPWAPWSITLVSLNLPVSSSSSSSSVPLSLPSSSSSVASGYSGVIASNNVASTLGMTVWNVNMVASFAPGNLVQITWTQDTSDYMIGTVTAVDPVALTITVDVTSISGPTGIPWSPWSITLLALNANVSSTGVGVNSASSSYSSFSTITTAIMMGMSAFLLKTAVV